MEKQMRQRLIQHTAPSKTCSISIYLPGLGHKIFWCSNIEPDPGEEISNKFCQRYGSSQQELQRFHPLHHLLWTGGWEASVRGRYQMPAWGVLRANNKTENLEWAVVTGNRCAHGQFLLAATLVKGPLREDMSDSHELVNSNLRMYSSAKDYR